MKRFICIHGHFYQPPRENPWLEAVMRQQSAQPFHDWNERVAAECYAPNSRARILDGKGRIVEIVNNFSAISFDFGPTLLSWLETHAPEIYRALQEADRDSRDKFSGHGSAMAQCHSHMIMPLANLRDKYTQVFWGIRDFEHRFKRAPEGMWLPETAVDLETLDIMAEQGIRFTLLAPSQARRIRPLQGGPWQDVSQGTIDTTQPYTLHLPSGESIHLFFYRQDLSRSLAFGNLLQEGKRFVHRLLDACPGEQGRPQLVHVATDGETYGHHHKFGDMALAYALEHIDSHEKVALTNYGEFLEKFPPTHEVEIIENTSWSCAHGVERWRGDCGCQTGGQPGWNQKWRAPLREALDWLRYTLAPAFREKAQPLLKDPWRARNHYIEVILDRSPKNIDRFLSQHAAHPLKEDEKITALKLLELQRHAQLMYTSCGWFFCELSGIETVQILQYAGRAVQLAGELLGEAVEPRFLDLLEQARSNLAEWGDGRRIFEKTVAATRMDPPGLCAHFALDSLFREFPQITGRYRYQIELQDFQSLAAGKARLALGRMKMTSEVTLESRVFHFSALHPGDYNLRSFVHEFKNLKTYARHAAEVNNTFSAGDFPGTLRLLEEHFDKPYYPLNPLSGDEQEKIFDKILDTALTENEALFLKLYESCAPLNRLFKDRGRVLPKAVAAVTEQVLNVQVRQALASREPDFERIEKLLREVKQQELSLDSGILARVFRESMEELAQRLFAAPGDLSLLRQLTAAVQWVPSMPFEVDLWRTQNICYDMAKNIYPGFKEKSGGDPAAAEWLSLFSDLADGLSIRLL